MENIKAIGFDLDQTLYQDTPEIQARVRGEIYELIAGTLNVPYEEAKHKFEELYAKRGGGGRTLRELGIENGSEALRDCLTRADVSQVLGHDEKLVALMEKIKQHYFTFLITESRKKDAEKKLQALGLSADNFNYLAFWDAMELRKHTGTIFPDLVKMSGFLPEQHLYCGDKINDDILPAKKAGLKTALVGSQSPEADICIPTIHYLEGYL